MSNPSRDYYSSSHYNPSRHPNQPQTLPPLRSVLGDELVLPVRSGTGPPSYEVRDVSRALPIRSSSGTSRMYADQSYPRRDSRTSTDNSQLHAGHSQSAYRGGSYGQHSAGGRDIHSHSYGEYSPSGSSSRTNPDQGSKKYACTWPGCGKRFERQHALDTHMNIHTEAKPFACPVGHCGKVFNVRSNMRRHLLTHKEYQPEGMDDADADDDDDDAKYTHSGPSRHSSGRVSSGEHAHSSSSSYYPSSRRL